MQFEIISKDTRSKARAGKFTTSHGVVQTPVFIPIATTGTVKALHQREIIHDIKAQIILANTYHLYLRPGIEIIKKAGGVHKFINFNKPILTDSGGYQIFSLQTRPKINEAGAEFQSHIDGTKHLFTPENVIDYQRLIGSDIIMAFDVCSPFPSEYNQAKAEMSLTHRWLERCIRRFKETEALPRPLPLGGEIKFTRQSRGMKEGLMGDVRKERQTLFPIVQGSVYKDLRKESCEVVASYECDGNAIGGLSVGEPPEILYEITDLVTDLLPEDKPRYLMGVGKPENILQCIALGIDMFDCIIPTHDGRHGKLYTKNGTINIKNNKWKDDFSPIDEDAYTFVDTDYTKAYLHHLVVSNEFLSFQIASIHNLGFFLWLSEEARKQIIEGKFYEWKEMMIQRVTQRL